MKTGLKIFIITALVMIGATSVVNAQKHRHSERNDSTEAAILKESNREVSDDVLVMDKLEESLEGISDNIEKEMEKFAKKYEGKKYFGNDNDNLLVSFFKGVVALLVVALVIIILTIIFGAPFLIIAAFFWFIVWLCKPSKKTEPTAQMAEPIDVVEMKTERKAKQKETMVQKAIMEIFIGIGLYVVSIILSSRFFAAIGAFMVIYGAGRCVIAKIANKKNEKPE